MDIKTDFVPLAITDQVAQACALLERHLASTLQAVHLYGSAVDGGLRPHSDIDLLVTVSAPPAEAVRQALLLDLLTVSAPPGTDRMLRALEVTAVAHPEIVPWRYPPRRELQFGEWLRQDLLAGRFEPAVLDIDLAVLLRKARHHSVALVGPAAEELFEPVPDADFRQALADILDLWNSPADWAGDERNIVLTLARIWYSAATGEIAPKDAAAAWALAYLPDDDRPILDAARKAYLGHGEDNLAARPDEVAAFIRYAKSTVSGLLRSVDGGRLSRLETDADTEKSPQRLQT